MFKHIFDSATHLGIYPTIGLLIFFGIFLIIIMQSLFMNPNRIQHMRNLPLEDATVEKGEE